jgi:hypothetical protein
MIRLRKDEGPPIAPIAPEGASSHTQTSLLRVGVQTTEDFFRFPWDGDKS